MKKGFFFSIDAVLGVIALIAVISTITIVYSLDSGREAEFQALKTKAMDKTTMKFYTGETGTESIGTGTQGYCAEYYFYEPDNGTAQSSPQQQIFCEET